MATKCVKVCRNGDSFFPPVNVVVNPRDIRNMDSFLDRVTQATRMRNAARRVCTPTRGHRVEDLTKLVSGKIYVAVGQEGFKTIQYGNIHVRKPIARQPDMKIEPVKHSRILMSARCRKVALWETAGLKTIYVYRNGDDKVPSHKILLDRRTLLNMDKVLEKVTERVKLESGAVFALYTMNAKEIQSTGDLVNGEKYVAVGHGKRFKRTAYTDNPKISPDNSPRRPKIVKRVLLMKRHPLSPTAGEVKPNTGEIKRERLISENKNEQVEKPTMVKKEAVVPQQITTEKHHKNDEVPKQKTKDSINLEREESHTRLSENETNRADNEPIETSQDKTIVGLEVSSNDEVFKASGVEGVTGKQVEDDRDVNVDKPIDQTTAEEVDEEITEVDENATQPVDTVTPDNGTTMDNVDKSG